MLKSAVIAEPPVSELIADRPGARPLVAERSKVAAEALAAARSGRRRDVTSGNDRRWVGPELSLPLLLGGRGGLAVGYLEESGWLDGRSAYAQLVAQPWAALRLLLRGSWAYERTLGVDRHDVGLLASAFADLSPHVALRLSVMGRGAFVPAGEGGAANPYGVTGHVALSASY